MDEPPRPCGRRSGHRRGPRDVPGPRRSPRVARGEHVRRPAADAGAGDELRDATEGVADRRALARPRPRRRRSTLAHRAPHGRRRGHRRVGRTERQCRAHGCRARVLHGARHHPLRRTDRRTARAAGPAALGVPLGGAQRRRRHHPPRHRSRSGRDRPNRVPRAVGHRAVGQFRRHTRRQRRHVRRVASRDRRRDRPERRRQDHRVRPDLRFHAARRGSDRAQRPQHHVVELCGPGLDGTRPLVPGRPPVSRADRRPKRSRSRRSASSGAAASSSPRSTCRWSSTPNSTSPCASTNSSN